ncbi:hypothetical protein [Streptomyces sp. RFCAC02]|uniref:hypothetical protein n=1 Tax=Streptomyces sp. RFCAC02 TaxID=2499143 RepID=UPI00102192AE|nr:hypothetical protein [Streptomyces sp. RFCAC02]
MRESRTAGEPPVHADLDAGAVRIRSPLCRTPHRRRPPPEEVIPLAVIGGCLLAVLGCLARLARRGTARAAFQVVTGAYDTMYRRTAVESHEEMRAQADRVVSFSSPDAPWRPADGGRARRPRRTR